MSSNKALTESQIADLREAFAMFDVNKDGSIEAKELKQVFLQLGQRVTSSEIKEMIKSVDGDENGAIDFDEFLTLMRKSICDPDIELRRAFDVFDKDKSGSISRDELKSLMDSLGQKLSESELDQIMNTVDENNDGEISFQEFKQMMSD